MADGFEDAFGVLQHIMVPETDDAITERLNHRGAASIDRVAVLPAVELDRQMRIATGEIGDLRGIRSAFTFNNAKDKGNVRYRKEWGGGSLYDVGCYPISAARLLMGKEPLAATVQAIFSPEHDDVDMMASGLLEFEDGVSLTFDCGMWAAFRNPLEVLGTDGIIEVPSAFVTHEPGSGNFYVNARGERRLVEVEAVNAYSEQADAMYRAVVDGEPPRYDSQDAIRNMKVVDACLKSAREKTRIEI